jgi:hypothetical protein
MRLDPGKPVMREVRVSQSMLTQHSDGSGPTPGWYVGTTGAYSSWS